MEEKSQTDSNYNESIPSCSGIAHFVLFLLIYSILFHFIHSHLFQTLFIINLVCNELFGYLQIMNDTVQQSTPSALIHFPPCTNYLILSTLPFYEESGDLKQTICYSDFFHSTLSTYQTILRTLPSFLLPSIIFIQIEMNTKEGVI